MRRRTEERDTQRRLDRAERQARRRIIETTGKTKTDKQVECENERNREGRRGTVTEERERVNRTDTKQKKK